jgi:hypothetical protein
VSASHTHSIQIIAFIAVLVRGINIIYSVIINEMSGACSGYGGEERRIQGFDGES